jgi:hypothetical protein
MGRLGIVACLLAAGCGGRPEIGLETPSPAVDALVIPGCPAKADGTLSPCLERRVIWGAALFARGAARRVIASGAAAANRVIEAEAIAAGLRALGVPPACTVLEVDARHTDENVFFALRLMRLAGFGSVAVASDAGQAGGACSMLESWHQPCTPAPLDEPFVAGRFLDDDVRSRLAAVKVAPVPAEGWQSVADFEAARVAAGGPERPGSFALYFFWAPLLRLTGDPWTPPPPPARPLRSYAEWLAARGETVDPVCPAP